jgi:hypothetical protein
MHEKAQSTSPKKTQVSESAFAAALLAILEIGVSRRRGPIDFMRRALREEISNIVFKILAGVVLASIIVYSTIRTGDAFHIVMQEFENGDLFELVAFGTLAVIGLVSFILLYKGSDLIGLFRRRSEAPVSPVAYEALLVKFAEGFLEGLNSSDSERPEQKAASKA